jgi:hypothetical protein
MVKHIVFWKLEPNAEGASAAENAARIKRDLEALVGRIPGLLEAEVGVDFNRSGAAWDLAYVSVFTDRASLDAYQRHPAHEPVAEFIAKVRTDRAVVDYEPWARGEGPSLP